MPLLANDKPYRAEVSATAGNFSSPIILPGWAHEFTITALPGGGGSASVFHTTDDPDSVEDDPANANWIEWDPGSVSVNTSQSLAGQVTGLRIQAVTADATLQVCGNRRL